jgi:hypothetical protein
MRTSVNSVGVYGECNEVKISVLESDKIRVYAQGFCKTIPGYDALPLESKNRIYDAVVASHKVVMDSEVTTC